MSITNKIYDVLPRYWQNIAINIYGYWWNRRRFGGVYKSELLKFKHREGYDSKQWEDYQETELRKILLHAFNNVPYYFEKYKAIGLSENDLANFRLSDLNKLPYLEKDDLRLFGKTTLISKNKSKTGKFYSSSGSTGTPTSIFYSRKMHQIWTAGYEARVKNWAGVNQDMTRGMIGGRRILPKSDFSPPYYRFNMFEKMVYFSAYHIAKQTAQNYIEGMKKHHVDFMMGYAMSNYFLARFINEENLDAPKLKAIITSSEKLTNEMREAFRMAYQCETFDTWSGVEMCAQISECEYHSLHESPDIGIIEVVDQNGLPITDGQAGEAICTSLINFDQPLIRYRCGDVLKPSNKKCECGREMRVFDEIIGRIEDVVISSDGREMVRFHGIFIDLKKIIKGQIIQHSLNNFEIKVICSSPLNQTDKEVIMERMESQLGKIDININEVSEIQTGKNGKFQAVISYVKRKK